MDYTLYLDNHPNPADIDILQQGLNTYNATQLKERPREFAIYLRDGDGNIHGGITAFSFSDSIHINKGTSYDQPRYHISPNQ